MGTAPTGYQTPKTNWAAGNVPTATDFNRIEGNINAVETGSRTIDPAQAPTGNVGTLRQLLDWFANRIKAITGKANWYDAPTKSMEQINSDLAAHLAETTQAHGGIVPSSDVVTVATANKILKLDANAKLPASITGNAATVAGKSVGNSSGQVPVSNGTVCTNLNSDKVDSIHFRVYNGILQYSTDGSVWYDVATLFSTSVIGSYSTSSSSWVTALEHIGAGALRGFVGQRIKDSTYFGLRLIVDGVTVWEHTNTGSAASTYNYGISTRWPYVQMDTDPSAIHSPTNIEFKQSLKIQICSDGTNAQSVYWALSVA